MDHLIRLKTTAPPLLMTLTLFCVGFFTNAQAVSPPPDGGYSGGNTAEGQNALFSLTTGVYNTANGYAALYHNTGNANTATGFDALYGNTSGIRNTADGYGALRSNTVGDHNTATGFDALYYNTTGQDNTANGYGALYYNTEGEQNTATGFGALYYNITGNFNTANGYQALNRNTTGDYNTAIGYEALLHNTTGIGNTAFGDEALLANTTGGDNTAIGDEALLHNTTGGGNTAIGFGALAGNSSGNFNIALGQAAGVRVTTANHVTCIDAEGNNVSNSCYIGNVFGATSSGGTAVFINSNGRLGTATSSRRFKDDIKPMESASEALFALKPVAFRYKKDIDPEGRPQLGLVAEEVEKVNPDLVVRDKEGKPYSVRYDQVNAMLLNEFLKENKAFVEEKCKVEELEANAARQQKQIEALTAGLQRVSAQLELSRPAPRTVLNDQ